MHFHSGSAELRSELCGGAGHLLHDSLVLPLVVMLQSDSDDSLRDGEGSKHHKFLELLQSSEHHFLVIPGDQKVKHCLNRLGPSVMLVVARGLNIINSHYCCTI